MARYTLTDLQIRQRKRPGYLCDGGGLRLRIQKAAREGDLRRSWVFRYNSPTRLTASGKPLAREVGLGSLDDVTLQDARAKADELRRVVRTDRKDPQDLDGAGGQRMTFQACAEAFIAERKDGWKNPKHAQQWPNSLAAYVYPDFGTWPVGHVDREAVIRVLKKVWQSKRETAGRLRGRIEQILDWATVHGYRTGENPARWTLLKYALPAAKTVAVKHHAAIPFADLPKVMESLRSREGSSARCLEFIALTAARFSEATGTTWGEIDLAGKIWIVPAERMKGRRHEATEHRVPLSDRACEILRTQLKLRADLGLSSEPGDLVFQSPGSKSGRFSDQAITKALRALGRTETVHGLRSTFRDWCAECTSFPREVAEAALHHVVGDRVEAAYRRGDLLEKRRQLMVAWSAYCTAPAMGEAARAA